MIMVMIMPENYLQNAGEQGSFLTSFERGPKPFSDRNKPKHNFARYLIQSFACEFFGRIFLAPPPKRQLYQKSNAKCLVQGHTSEEVPQGPHPEHCLAMGRGRAGSLLSQEDGGEGSPRPSPPHQSQYGGNISKTKRRSKGSLGRGVHYPFS